MTATLFELEPVPDNTPGPNEQAVIDLCAELEAAELLTGRYKALAISIRQTARAVDAGMRASKITVATATLNKMLIDALKELPNPRVNTRDDYDNLATIVKELTEAAARGTIDEGIADYD